MIVNVGPGTPPSPPAYIDPALDPETQRAYAQSRRAEGLTWAQLSERFTRDNEPRLAAWATANGRAEQATRGAAAPLGRTSKPQQTG